MFERLLLGQTQRKVFIIHNTSLLRVKWHLAGADALPPEFKLLPSSGEVPPRQEVPVTVEFTALQKKDLSEKVTLQVSNTECRSTRTWRALWTVPILRDGLFSYSGGNVPHVGRASGRNRVSFAHTCMIHCTADYGQLFGGRP